MEKESKIPFHTSYERDAKGSYLVLKLEKEDIIQEFQVEMMINNNIPSLLPFNLRIKDAYRYLYYDITSKLQVGQFLLRRKLTKGQLIGILIDIIKGILEAGNYLLHHESFIIDEDFIFIHPETLEISLLYVPCKKEEGNIILSLRQLINRLVWATESEKEGDHQLLLKILYELNKETFNLKEFLSFLRQIQLEGLKDNTDKTDGGKINKNKEQINKNKDQIVKPKENQTVKSIEKSVISKSELEMKLVDEVSAIIQEEKLVYSTKTKLTLLLAEVLILIVVALLWLETNILFDSTTGNIDGVSLIGIVLLAAVINILLFKKLLVEENLVTVQVEKNHNKINNEINNKIKARSLKMDKKEINSTPQELNIPSTKINSQFNNKSISNKPSDGFKEELFEETFDTEIIEINTNLPQLVALQGGQGEKVNINSNPLVIGKLKDQVDYLIANKTISRVHAEIHHQNGQYYLKDLNSRNGTYINGERINSNIDYSLKDGDQISFANLDYLFTLPQNYGAESY
ncbi:DUF6382 domain-containing protein [Alkaliphilus transvaalensis]|uniref:DUF6382 domain-containing protein n=1 Tax=Alkaliphilus transvaalensis TaxID=114628 RepID=UPI00047C9DAA|nr:DUF6382 domain-containing protein [Alkaliphilus transvaalensis]